MNKYKNDKNLINYNINLINLFEQNNTKQVFSLLEIGCNTGYNIKQIHNRFPKSELVGVDIMNQAIQQAKENCPYADFYTKNIEQDTRNCLSYRFHFDYIFFPDVLEHLSNPLLVLKEIQYYLKPGGKIYACIPNLMHWSIMYNLLMHGNFTYTETGLLDSDHKHLFTYNEIINMFNKAGLFPNIYSIVLKYPDEIKLFIESLINITSLKEFQFTTFQYLVIT